MSLTFNDYLTTGFAEVWDSPTDLRWFFDALASVKNLVWMRRGDTDFAGPQFVGVPLFSKFAVEVRVATSPPVDAWTAELILAEANFREGIGEGVRALHCRLLNSLTEDLPFPTVLYSGRA